ncbi:MAG: hypothetical protein WA191_07115 [Telluria sp.]
MSLTNGHEWIGYKDGDSHVPALPLKTRCGGASGRCLEVIDADGYWMATFRNDEDAAPYITDLTARYNAGYAAYRVRCASTSPERDDGKTPCPGCGKFFGSVRQHRKQSTKCKAIGVAP